MNADPTRRFSTRASHYARWRPGYPAQLLGFFRDQLHLNSTDSIADIGSGTGILTELLLKNGNPVTAIEPNAEMRQMAEDRLGSNPNFRSLAAPAEQTSLPDHSVRMITVAQAFHWFDRAKVRPEFARILQPGGWVCLIWNERKTDQPFAAAYKRFTNEFTADRCLEHHRTLTDGGFQPIRQFFTPQTVEVASFPNEQILDLEGLTGRVLSNSNTPLEGHPLYAAMIQRIRELFEQFQVGGRIRFEYDTRVYYGRLS